jgi:hypothetical protein
MSTAATVGVPWWLGSWRLGRVVMLVYQMTALAHRLS